MSRSFVVWDPGRGESFEGNLDGPVCDVADAVEAACRFAREVDRSSGDYEYASAGDIFELHAQEIDGDAKPIGDVVVLNCLAESVPEYSACVRPVKP